MIKLSWNEIFSSTLTWWSSCAFLLRRSVSSSSCSFLLRSPLSWLSCPPKDKTTSWNQAKLKAKESARRKRRGSLPNPGISSVASLLHARGFHILFFCCLTRFPKTPKTIKHLHVSLYCGHKQRKFQKYSSIDCIHTQKSFYFDLCLNCSEVL